MASATPLQPTLWRTCRVVASRTRLQFFGLLVQEPGQSVSWAATRLSQPLSVASESLRMLEARGLLTVSRTGRRVTYQLARSTGDSSTGLTAALRFVFQRESQPVETVFKLATAFTHPRRIEIFRVIQTKPQTLAQIHAATGIPGRALQRHLSKLESRGFIVCRLGIYSVVKRTDAFGCELARLATG